MITLEIFLILLTLHYLGDFIFQSKRMRKFKSTNMEVLFAHVITYTICISFLIGYLELINYDYVFEYFIIWLNSNALIHFGIDYVTSKINSQLYKKNKKWALMNMIQFDQLLHIFILYATFIILLT